MFQDYFLGRGKAIMIVNISPCSIEYDETIHVLKFSGIKIERIFDICKAVAKEITTVTKLDTGRSVKSKVDMEEIDVAVNERIQVPLSVF
jgi:hypothetical protein